MRRKLDENGADDPLCGEPLRPDVRFWPWALLAVTVSAVVFWILLGLWLSGVI